MIQRSDKIKLKPTVAQDQQLWNTVDAARYSYNWGLERWEKLYHEGESCSAYTLSALWTQERPEWTHKTARKAQTRSFMHLEGAYNAYFDSVKGLSKQYMDKPSFKKKGRCRDSFYFPNTAGKLYPNKTIQIPKVGRVKMCEAFRYKSARILSYVVSHEPDGWYVSIQCEIDDTRPTPRESVVGVDVGIKCWAVASDGTKLEPPKRLKYLRRVAARKQRLLARKQKGSNRYKKAANTVARIYQRIRRISYDAIHKFTTTLAKNHSVVVVEDLNVAGMRKSWNKGIRRGINYSEMSKIIALLEYKAKRLIKVPRFYPSSKTCSNCGHVKDDLTLSDRTYHCRSCGIEIDRDLKAALNIKQKGQEIIAEGHSESLNDREVERHGDR